MAATHASGSDLPLQHSCQHSGTGVVVASAAAAARVVPQLQDLAAKVRDAARRCRQAAWHARLYAELP